MSPYLFVLCVEYLSRLLATLARNPSFSFHPKCKRTSTIPLLFADDLLIFYKGDLKLVLCIKSVIERFVESSGLVCKFE